MTAWVSPGRINLIGEHTDYNDGFVLPFAIAPACRATVTDAASGWTVRSGQEADPVTVPIGPMGITSVPDWSRYVLGVLWLLHARGVDVPDLSVTVDSEVPVGAGLSSSAALVCSVASAVDDHLRLGLDAAAMLDLTREVENVVVGAPTGGMDQLVSLRGTAGHALLCDMRSLTIDPVPFEPDDHGLALLVINTMAPHRLVGGEYAARRDGCEDAAAALGVRALRDVAASDLDAALDRLTDADQRHYVRHVVTENDRVVACVDLLRDGRIGEIGPLLSASHASMRDDFAITVPEVDAAAEALLEAGALGSRMTGGGFGGCVIGLVAEADVPLAVEGVVRAFADRGFASPVAFTAQAGPGARRVS